MNVIYVFIAFVVVILDSALCDRLNFQHMLYESFPNAVSCFRILNGTHQFGCYSTPSGSLGVVHIINTIEDSNWLFTSDAVAGPYMIVVTPEVFSDEKMLKLGSSSLVSGILVAANKTAGRPNYLSPDDTCPNRYTGLPNTCAKRWNPYGSSLMLQDWGKPIFFVNDEEVISKVNECFKRFNLPLDKSQLSRNLCSLQMRSHMYAAVNTPTCIERSKSFNIITPVVYCDPMGDRNIVASLFPLKKVSNKSLIVITTRLDTATMFDGLAPGAMSTATGIVTLMAAAKLLSEMIPYDSNYERNVLFIMFSGESYDYIGSSRAVYDILNKQFPTKSHPINLSHIGLMFEVNQLGKTKNLFVHYDDTKDNSLLKEFNTVFNSYAEARKIQTSLVPVGKSVPPTSVHSFLKTDPNLPYLILSNYKDQYVNRFYSSIFDNSTNIDYVYYNGTNTIPPDSVQSVLADLSTTLAKTLYTLVTNRNDTSDERVKPELIDDLLHCYLDTKQCQIFTENFPNDRVSLEPGSFYVGVSRSNNLIVTLTQSTLASFTGNDTKMSSEACNNARLNDKDYEYIWITGKSGQGVCIKSNVRFTVAVSPAFELPDYDWTSGQYPTWSESVWQDLSLRMYLKPSRMQEIGTVILGLVILITSFVVVNWLKLRSTILFHSNNESL